MDQNSQADPYNVESFRGYLTSLARSHLDPRLRSRLDPEDIVQATLLKAYKNIGADIRNLKAWLRTILLRTTLDEVLKLPADDVRESSSFHLGSQIPDDATPPAERAQKNEEGMRLDDAMTRLPERQREAVELRYFHAWRVKEICRHMKLTLPAVVGLLNRGLENLRRTLDETE
jgi:RNA polymerase sigma factor (sigma-70 family)